MCVGVCVFSKTARKYFVAISEHISDLVSKSDPLAKNLIEFQRGNNLPGTSSEALGVAIIA